ncbi:hypothetical protein L6V77_03580 [Myxococcota bacterium]|nr:hypothetical protein [Myxococcota bacterium]
MNATNDNGLREHFAFLRERYQILLRRRAGQPAPWTLDPVLQAWRFCNVRREDDRTTIVFRETVREPLRDDPHVLLATIAWRWFNLIETGEILRPFLMSRDAWNRPEVERLLQARHDAGDNIFTGAFMVNSPQNEPKLPAILNAIDWCYRNIDAEKVARTCTTKKAMFKQIEAVPRQGAFTAYQVVVDLTHTALLERAPDFNSFTVAGPGCAKGIGRVFHGDPTRFNYGSRRDQAEMLRLMVETLEASRDPELWPSDWPPFILSDIENSFCEAQKYGSAREGNRQKRRFRSDAA